MTETGPRRILIVDDEPDTREVIVDFLEDHGYEVLQAGNGLEALLQVKRMRPHGVVLDLQMPRLGGLDALKRIHAFDASIVVVVVTGGVDPDVRRRARDLGAVAILDKPFNLADLLATLPAASALPPASAPPPPRTLATAVAAPPADRIPTTPVEPAAVPTAAAPAAPDAEPPAAPGPAISVLIVDDDPDVRATLEEFLGAKGYAVRSASSGAGAVREIASAPADLILLDIDMPGLSGVDALPTLRALAPRAAVIMVSGSLDVELSRRALTQGAFDFVIKPIDFDYLVQTLETALAMREV